MLDWKKENDKYLGFDDGTLMYIVSYDEKDGWYWLDVREGWYTCSYANAEKAKDGAEDDYTKYPKLLAENIEPFLTLEELCEILSDSYKEC